MLADSREGVLFSENGCYKKINADGLMEIMDLPYLMHGCQKGPFSQDGWKTVKLQVLI